MSNAAKTKMTQNHKDTQARVYVGTYGKYNSGSIDGAWLDLEDYSDKAEFLEACAELHKGEHDPEFMFQDYEGIPAGMVSESHIDEEVWEWLELDDDDRELLAVYRDNVNQDGTIDDARDAFLGKYDSEEGWAQSFLEETGAFHGMPELLVNYFDFAAYARDFNSNGGHFVRHDGDVWVFQSV